MFQNGKLKKDQQNKSTGNFSKQNASQLQVPTKSQDPDRAQTTYLTSLPRNVNYYGHFFKEHYITEKDIDWVLKLRTQDLELKNKLARIPNQSFQVSEKKIQTSEQKHSVKDIESQYNLTPICHLLRHRLGATPSLGTVKFETGLRHQKNSKLKEKEKGWNCLPKKDRHEFPELPIKIKDEITKKKEIKTTGKYQKITNTAFDGFQNYPKYNEKCEKVKNFQQVKHMYTNGSPLSNVQWALNLR